MSEDKLANVVTPAVIEEVRAKLKNGMDVEAVCMQLGIANVNAVVSMLKNVQEVDFSTKSNAEILEDQKILLLQMIEAVKYEVLADPGNGRTVFSVTALMQTLQAIITDLEGRKDPKRMSSDILTKVVQPLMRAMIKALTIESSKARADIVSGLGPEQNKIVDFAIKDMLKGFGASITKEYAAAAQAINSLLDTEIKEEKLDVTTIEVMPNVQS